MTGQNKFLKAILLLGDIFVMYVALFLALAVRNINLLAQFNGFVYSFFALYVFWIIIIFILNLYDLNFFKKRIDFFFSLAVFSVLAFLSGVTYFYFRPTLSITPKTILLLNVIVLDVLFLIWRYLANLFLEAEQVKESAVIVGFYKRLGEILPQIRKIYSVEAIFCPPDTDEHNGRLFISPDINIVSKAADLKNIVTEKRVTSIIFSLDFYSNKDIIKEIFNSLPLTLNYIGIDDLYESITKKVSLGHLDEIWFLEKISKPVDIFEQIVKRLFDVILSIMGLAIFIVFLPFIAIAIRAEDKGPVFYNQKRVGKNGRLFLMHKFRTMKEDKNQHKETWREINKDNITKVGKVLRRLHLDELPQAWNIFRGELSFVGPRAEWSELADVFEKEIPFYKQRYLAKPGLIGWAQINFPASKSVDEAKEKFEYDLYYIKNHSILLDIEIILKAVKLFLW